MFQTEYSFMTRDPEHNGVLKACEELGIGFVPWGPVGMGYLTGKIDARSKLDPIVFTPGEAAAIITALVGIGPYTSPAAGRALNKLIRSLTS